MRAVTTLSAEPHYTGCRVFLRPRHDDAKLPAAATETSDARPARPIEHNLGTDNSIWKCPPDSFPLSIRGKIARRQYRSNRQKSVLSPPWPMLSCWPVGGAPSALSGDQMMLRPGRSDTSRTTSPPGSFHMTRRLTHNRGSVSPSTGVNSRPCGAKRSGCCGIGDPPLHVVWQCVHCPAEVDSPQRFKHESRTSIRPAGGIDSFKSWTGRPRAPLVFLD